MADLFASGRIIDFILVFMLLEIAALAVLRRAGKGVPRLRDLMPNLVSGAFLMLAVRAALTEGPWTLIAVFLLGALAAHLADLVRQWPMRRRLRGL